MKQLFLICSVIALAFTSCYSYSPPPSRFLDVEKHNEMLKKWKELNIKNYSFTYSFDYWRVFPRFKVIGYVTVKDGKGKVVFESNSWENELDTLALEHVYYYITNMEEVFQHVLDQNEKNKQDMTKKKLQWVWYDDERYDTKYFFPKYIYYFREWYGYKPNPHVVGISAGPIDKFEITDFEILE